MTLEEMYQNCVESHQRLNDDLNEAERILIDEGGTDGMTLADCARALIEERDRYKWMYEGLCK